MADVPTNLPLHRSTSPTARIAAVFTSIGCPAAVALAAALCLAGPLSAAAPPSDEFLSGYATAILKRDFQITAEYLRVRHGVVYIQGLQSSDTVNDRIQTSLSAIDGVRKVVITREGEVTAVAEQPAITPEVNVFLPRDLLFASLLADPRWPHFSASYQHHSNNELQEIGSATFGETFSIYRFAGPWQSLIEVGLHAGVFSIFDLAADSHDLVNADYLVAIPLSLKKDNFSMMSRIFHQSSHLGDEYLLRGQQEKRINFSYEGLDTILSYAFPFGFRLYGGGGYLFDRTPSDLEPWIAQGGMEFTSPGAWWNGSLRPIAAIDVQSREASDWDTDVSVRAGVQLENPDFLSRKLKIMVEYYRGSSPNGQFHIRDEEEYLGIGFHFFL